jgi:hypothetical protein
MAPHINNERNIFIRNIVTTPPVTYSCCKVAPDHAHVRKQHYQNRLAYFATVINYTCKSFIGLGSGISRDKVVTRVKEEKRNKTVLFMTINPQWISL